MCFINEASLWLCCTSGSQLGTCVPPRLSGDILAGTVGGGAAPSRPGMLNIL
jgi:hypothetical protein